VPPRDRRRYLDLAQVQDVVARHLLRFAFREPPTIEWHGATDVQAGS